MVYSNKDYKFWNGIKVDLIVQLYKLYQLDFEMFDYDPIQYFRDHGMNSKADRLKTYLSAYPAKLF